MEHATDLVYGVFDNEEEFRNAVSELEELDAYSKDISIMMHDEERAEKLARETGTGTKAGKGAAVGALAGGIGGVLLGVTAAALPGGVLLAGPAAIGLGITGAAAGGIVGALVGLGIPEEKAKYIEERLAAGDVLVLVPSFDADEVIDVMQRNGAVIVDIIHMHDEMQHETNPWLSDESQSRWAEGRA